MVSAINATLPANAPALADKADVRANFAAAKAEIEALQAAGGGIGAISDASDVDTTGRADGDILTWDQAAGAYVSEAPAGGGGLVTISGNTTLTFAAHQGRTLFCTAAVSLTVDAATDFAAGNGCNIVAEGGIVTIVATATVNRAGSKPLTIPRYDAASLLRTSTADVYLLFGGMA